MTTNSRCHYLNPPKSFPVSTSGLAAAFAVYAEYRTGNRTMTGGFALTFFMPLSPALMYGSPI